MRDRNKDMQKKIALIEPYRHSEVLRSLAILLDHQGWTISIFTNPTVKADLYELDDYQQLHWFVGDTQTPTAFLKHHHEQLARQDLLLFVTLVTDFKALRDYIWPAPSLLILHNGHTFLAPYSNLIFPKRLIDWGRFLRFLLFRQARQRRQLLASVDYLCGPSEEIQTHWLKTWPSLKEQYQWIKPLPFAFFEGSPTREASEVVRIVIPGTVNPEGRNYDLVREALQKVLPRLKRKVELLFLGSANRAEAKKVLRSFTALETDNFRCLTFSNILPQADFDRYLRTTDFLLLPLRSHYPLGLIRERYGFSNISGGLNDALRFGIPVLLPKHYPIPAAIETLVESYTNAEQLADLLYAWIEESGFIALRDTASEQLAPYRAEVLSEALDQQLSAILSR